MDSTELVYELKKPFELKQHNIRTGGRGKWYVYVQKDAIIDRLDSLVPMEWQTRIVDTVRIDDRVEVVMEMAIGDITRSFDGVSEDNRKKAYNDKPEVLYPLNTRKAATTDAFKRVAMCFGIGSYLSDVGTIESGNENDAKRVFAAWYKNRFQETQKQPAQEVAPQPEPETEQEPTPGNQDRPAVWACKFTHMNYNVNGKGKYLGFATGDPMASNSEGMTVIRAYGRTTKVKEWLGEFAYKELNLGQYTGCTKTSNFVEMPIAVEFEYVEKTTKAKETFLEATGVVGNDSF